MPVKRNSIIEKLRSESTSKKISNAGSGGGNGRPSITIVNSRCNGKRVMLSKALKTALGIEYNFCVEPYPDDGCIALAKELPNCENVYHLSEADERSCYSSVLVNYLTKTFNIDYTEVTSHSFADIDFEDLDGKKVAIIKLSEPTVTDEESEKEIA